MGGPFTLRVAVLLVAMLGVAPPLAAQVEVAPAPHPTLGRIAKEHEQYKLPLPGPDWRLVTTRVHSIAFWKPTHRGGHLISGTSIWSEQTLVPERNPLDPAELIANLKRDPKFIRDRHAHDPAELTCIAVQCLGHGQQELAGLLYAIAVDLHRTPEDVRVRTGDRWESRPRERTMEGDFRSAAFRYWSGHVGGNGDDRRTALQMMQLLDPDHADTRDLALTLAPGIARMGSPEALIDELTEYSVRWDDEHEFPAIERLIGMGFDAVPALIEHCQDMRFTRARTELFNNFRPYQIRVGHLCSQILDGILGDELGIWNLRGDMADPGAALKAYGRALWIGEERWLALKCLPMLRREPEFLEPGEEPVLAGKPNLIVLRALASRFPQRITPVYQTILYKREDTSSDLIAALTGSSRLERGAKLKLLEEAAMHPSFRHRVPAIRALQTVDSRVFRRHLLAALQSLGTGSEIADYAFGPEARMAELLALTDDRECWDGLIAASKRAVPSLRIAHIAIVHQDWKPLAPNDPRHEKVRYLHRFLADDSRQGTEPRKDGAEPPRYMFEDSSWTVGEFASIQIGRLLKLPAAPPTVHAGALLRFLYRARATLAAENELKRPRGP